MAESRGQDGIPRDAGILPVQAAPHGQDARVTGAQHRVISGNIVDLTGKRIYPGVIHIANGMIERIVPDDKTYSTFLMPGFVDAHVHIESSMLVPSQFARLASVHGTVATVSDPHEIGNVLGVAGVEYMIEEAATSPLKFNFGAPSCVPATTFETAGATIDAEQVGALMARPDIKYLSEVMNFPGVIAGDADLSAKIAHAKKHIKRIDGHAPGLRGPGCEKYFAAGVSTDHECYTIEEAEEKLRYGVQILIREGSAAKNWEALFPLIDRYPDRCMFCTDDKHPNELERGHINEIARRSVARGAYVMNVLRCACINPVKHYNLNVGLLAPGDPADFIEVADLKNFTVLKTFINGQLVAENGKSLLATQPAKVVNRFDTQPKSAADFAVKRTGDRVNVIGAIDGQLVTHLIHASPGVDGDNAVSNPAQDILKIAVVNRYKNAPPAVGFIRGFGLTRGAIASSVAHDSHNIVAVGVSDSDICRAVNLVIAQRGGLSAVNGAQEMILPLPVAGIMSNADGYDIARQYADIDRFAKQMGSTLAAPFMTLSFMALLVIPSLKMSDLGLFDGDKFQFRALFE
jgi:adenine deaminase